MGRTAETSVPAKAANGMKGRKAVTGQTADPKAAGGGGVGGEQPSFSPVSNIVQSKYKDAHMVRQTWATKTICEPCSIGSQHPQKRLKAKEGRRDPGVWEAQGRKDCRTVPQNSSTILH